MLVTGGLYCDFENFLLKESVTIKITKDFSYENDVVSKRFYFYDKVIVPELFTRNIKVGRTCKELLEVIETLMEKSEIIKKAAGRPEISSVKKVLEKASN